MNIREQNLDYKQYLNNSDFIKYGIVISSFVWGKSYSQISDCFEISDSYISKVLKTWREEGKFTDNRKNNGGHNKKGTQAIENSLIMLVEKDRSQSVRQLSETLREEMDIEVSKSTVSRILSDLDYTKSLPYPIPYLSDYAIERRLQYAQEYMNDKFSNVVFSDESTFQLCENRQLVWWNPSSEKKPVITYPHDKRKVMIWGAISRKGSTELEFWKISADFKVTAQTYVKCLNQNLVKRMDRLYGMNKWRFMHDNARVHTAEITQEFVETKDLKVIMHPPYSPDLNPIEKVWGYLKKRVMTKAYTKIDEVIEAIKEEWNQITIEQLNNLIDAHCRRVQEVYNLNGEFIDR
jgi:transposase